MILGRLMISIHVIVSFTKIRSRLKNIKIYIDDKFSENYLSTFKFFQHKNKIMVLIFLNFVFMENNLKWLLKHRVKNNFI